MPQPPERPFNSREYQHQLERELIVGGIVITILLGGGLIAWIWGETALLGAVGCFALALGIGAAVWGVLKLIEVASRE